MKPVSDALLNWMKVLYTHDEFAYCNFWHHHVKPRTKVPAASMPHTFRIAKYDVPTWIHENQREPVLAINLIPDRDYISVYVRVKRPAHKH